MNLSMKQGAPGGLTTRRLASRTVPLASQIRVYLLSTHEYASLFTDVFTSHEKNPPTGSFRLVTRWHYWTCTYHSMLCVRWQHYYIEIIAHPRKAARGRGSTLPLAARLPKAGEGAEPNYASPVAIVAAVGTAQIPAPRIHYW